MTTQPTKRAALLTSGIARSHPFVQGNKRTAWMIGLYFLGGYNVELENINVSEAEAVVLALVNSVLDEDGYALWLTGHMVSLDL